MEMEWMMEMNEIIQVSTLRQSLSDVLSEVEKKKNFLIVGRKGKAVSALVNLDFFEDLLAAHSPTYLKSIKEAREDAKKGRLYTHQEVFGKL